MLKIKILSVGKTKESWLEQGIQEYIKRLQPTAHIECIWTKNEEQLEQLADKEPSLIALDAGGRSMSSEEFSVFLNQQLIQQGSRLTFVIGGDKGLPAGLKKSSCISLSSLTFTHQMVRLILLEQIYRAFEIQKGTPYHK